MQDIGRIRDTVNAVEGKDNKEKYYPSVSISSKQLPMLKGKKFGDSIELHIKGEIGGMHEDYDDKKEAEYEIKVMQAGTDKVGKDKYMKMSDDEKDKEDEKEILGKK